MWKLLGWLVAFVAGAALTHVVSGANLTYFQPGPSSLPFMMVSLLIVTVIYQARVNLENPPPDHARFVFAPPDVTIMGEVAAFFAGGFAIMNYS